MAFATAWLEKRALFPELIPESPDPQTGIIVVVPAFDEPDIEALLDSLTSCERPGCGIEIIIIINAPASATQQSLKNNTVCVEKIRKWQLENSRCFFRVYYYNTGVPLLKGWGAGLARKTGMDEALRRFNSLENPDGVIVSLDADCTVAKNYFTEICSELYKRKDHNACSIYFEHPLYGSGFSEDIYRSVALYELHMRYFYQAAGNSGYPYTFHTIGSAMAFKASAYLKAGGMNRKQAGEDFYFIQKLIPQDGYFALNSTTVYPSPRRSGRVPFGTGPVISRMLEGSETGLMTYNPAAFGELKLLFLQVEKLFRSRETGITSYYRGLPPGVRSFVSPEEWIEKITEINHNTSTEDSFTKRFFSWFNMFRIVKYLNHVHISLFEKNPVPEAAYQLLSMAGTYPESKDPLDLLIHFRLMEKGKSV